MSRPIVLDPRPLGERLEARARQRQERLDWIKVRALSYLPGDVGQAIASFVSDCGKDWDDLPAPFLDVSIMLPLTVKIMMDDDAQAAENWIKGFN